MHLLILALFIPCVFSRGFWMEQPYGDDEFNLRVEYGDEFNITCEDPRLPDTPVTVNYWVIPDLTIMDENNTYKDFKTLDGQAGWEINPGLTSLRVFVVTDYHFGFYHCMVTVDNTGEKIMVKRGLNYKGPYFDDTWEEYRMNTIVGLSSSIVFLGISSGVYGFVLWWDSRKEKKRIEPTDGHEEELGKRHSTGSRPGLEGFTNEAIVEDSEQANGAATSESKF